MSRIVKGAVISPCGLYRYSLWRVWNSDAPKVAFVGLNPSTADATHDDNTIRKCIAFADSWGCGGLLMVNLFAYRATQPKDMMQATDPVGPENNKYLVAAMGDVFDELNLMVAAWGRHGSHQGRDKEVLALLDDLHCLKLNSDGSPQHPLYLPGDTPLLRYPSGERVEPQPRRIAQAQMQPMLALTG